MTVTALFLTLACVFSERNDNPQDHRNQAMQNTRTTQESFEVLFAQARDGAMEEYRQATEQFRRRGEPAAAWLHAKVLADPEGQEGWLASILLARLLHGEALSALEGELGAKMVDARHNYPTAHITGRTRGNFSPLLIADEVIDEEQLQRYRPGERNAFRRYWNSLRVSKSEHWGPLCGEILLKGWDGALPQPRPGIGVTITEEQFVAEAVNLLCRLGERRALPRIREMVRDDECAIKVRSSAMGALARLGGRQDVREVLELAKDEKQDFLLRVAAIVAVEPIAGADELPALEEIAALRHSHVSVRANLLIRRIQERVAAAEAATRTP